MPPQAGYRPPPRTPGDPLTGTPDESFAGWFTRSWGFFRRNWLPASLIAGGALLIPGVLMLVPGALLYARLFELSRLANEGEPVHPGGTLVVLYLVMLPLALLLLYAQSAAQVAIMRLIAREAVGRPRDIAADVRFGLRRGWVLGLWQLLEIPIVLVGFCACIIPGYYLQLAMSQTPALVAFEPGRHALRRSFRLMHSDFWPSVGRMLITAMIVGMFGGVIGMIAEIPMVATMATAAGPDGTVNATSVQLAPWLFGVFFVLVLVASAPGVVAQCAGALGTYTGLRAKEQDAPTGEELVAAME
ncbi:hypothetical protein Athai_02980 [Actinocatenispora thailandica]|uniref:Glycerophosphoryl diester phosphodiesterase membrane domain-containing protein n=1 Tax=Actinocatenispora thailandica TaxID=227318 RepID=A0A7R7DJQ8_9ACTN|nr:hypothetical protein [Actinocatenispora thailandica]BCJ32795.1 hypothetical protein Athai_02980 [Actinocatenispora thailandica]